MTDDAVVYRGSHHGRLPRLNEWHGAHAIGGKARIFKSTKYRKATADMAASFSLTRPEHPIDFPVDLRIAVSMWSRIDSDAPVKGIMDALELAGVLNDDKCVRDFSVRRFTHRRDAADRVQIILSVASDTRENIE